MYSILLAVMLIIPGFSHPSEMKDGLEKLIGVFSKIRWEVSEQKVRKVFLDKQFDVSGTFEGMKTIGYFDTLDRDTVLISFHFTKQDKLVRLDVAFLVRGKKKVETLSNRWKETLTKRFGGPAALAEGVFLWMADQNSVLILGMTPKKELGIQYWQKGDFFDFQRTRLRNLK